MKKLATFILALVFTVSIALAVINTTFATQKTEKNYNYSSITIAGPTPGDGNTDKPK